MRFNEDYIPRLHKSITTSQHYLMARGLLNRFNQLAQVKGFTILEDNEPFHTILQLPNKDRYSVYCGGFELYLDLQKLNNNGETDVDFIERRYVTIRGLLQYLKKQTVNLCK